VEAFIHWWAEGPCNTWNDKWGTFVPMRWAEGLAKAQHAIHASSSAFGCGKVPALLY